MTISSEIERLQTAKANIKTSIEGKGVTVPSATKLDGYASLIDAISGGDDSVLLSLIDRSITRIEIPDSVTAIGNYTFDSCFVLEEVIIPTSVTRLGMRSFENTRALETIVIPNSVTTIEMNAFSSSSALKTVVIGNGITTIGNGAFAYCSQLESFTVRATTPPSITTTTFDNCPSNFNIYVPSASVNTYKTATNWSRRASYIQAIPG